MSKHLQMELDKIKSSLLTISSLVERNLTLAVRAVKEIDAELVQQINESDFEIDTMEVDLEEECLKTLALHQPVASDLRFVVVALKMNNELERVGDLAVNLAERAKYLSQLPKIEVPFDFESMAKKVKEMVKQSITALIEMDLELAKSVIKSDDFVDEIHRGMYASVFGRIKQNSDQAEQLIHYLTVSRFLERIADYSTNIAEDVVYMIDGSIIRHERRPRDKSL
ncbi:MAG: phosphate signaling complex protein PhoU [Bdellovibrionales bacterium]